MRRPSVETRLHGASRLEIAAVERKEKMGRKREEQDVWAE